MIERVDRAFGAWQPKSAAPAQLAPSDKIASELFILDAPWTSPHYLVAFPVPARSTPERAALMVAWSMLKARISDQIRDHVAGAALAVDDEQELRRFPGLFAVHGEAPANVAGALLDAVLDEVARLERGTFSEHELAFALAALRSELASNLAHTISTLRLVSELAQFDLPLTDLTTYAGALYKLSKADVQAAARAHLSTASARIVALGAASELMGSLSGGSSVKPTVKPTPPTPSPSPPWRPKARQMARPSR